jgi:hypothetical protein
MPDRRKANNAFHLSLENATAFPTFPPLDYGSMPSQGKGILIDRKTKKYLTLIILGGGSESGLSFAQEVA